MKIDREEPTLIKWKISAAERRSQNQPDRKEYIISERKKVRATKETREKSRHDRTVSFKKPLHPCSCLDNNYKTPCNVMLEKLAKFKK